MEIQDINIVSTGSKGNCELYFKTIAIDMGLPFNAVKPYIKDLQIVLLSHIHADHFNYKTLEKLSFERPTLRFGMGEHMIPYVPKLRNVDIYKIGEWYDYGAFKISPVKLYHDVDNFGYRIFVKKQDGSYYKIFRATDTSTLNGISAKNYDAYILEHNYDDDTIDDQIAKKEEKGEYAYQKDSKNTHLSEQEAREFIRQNKKKTSEIIRLHESSAYF